MKKIMIGHSLLGDALFAEPALRAYAQVKAEPIQLTLNGPARILYEDHPDITLEPDSSEGDGSWLKLGPSYAFQSSAARGKHICEGFFFRLGLNPEKFDTKPRLYLPELSPESQEEDRTQSNIFLAPFSASCSVHTSGIPNKTIDLGWWEALASRIDDLGFTPISLGAKDEPTLKNAINWRGDPIEEVSMFMRKGQMLIAGDTGLTAIAGAMNMDIVLLSSAVPVWLTGPQTAGKLETLLSNPPPAWKVKDVMKAIERILHV